jgi:hypothetical protein
VRKYVDGQTEMAPPVAGPGETSCGGVARVWNLFRDRIALVHFQPNNATELMEMIRSGTLPPSLSEFRQILPEIAERNIPVVIEVSPPIGSALRGGQAALQRKLAYCGVISGATRDAICRVRDVLVRDAAGA